MEHHLLLSGWQLRQQRSANPAEPANPLESWITASVPGTVHQDLLAAQMIPDPFVGLNENEVQGVGESDWLYRCTFDVNDTLLAQPHIDLNFEGLDTFATVWLNGQMILQSDNMFVPARVSVKPLLQAKGNVLDIQFASALRRGKELEAQHGGKRPLWNGDSSRLYVRKAQYHYGWDWGPCLLTAGIWKPVTMEGYETRIADVHIPVEVSEDLRTASLPVTVQLAGETGNSIVIVELIAPDGQTLDQVQLPGADTHIEHTFTITNPALWFPHGYGAQPRYTVAVRVERNHAVLDQWVEKLGLRRLRLVQEPLRSESGTSFYFEINNLPIFCGGANWIPADSFTPRLTLDDYRQWLHLTVDGNMIMLRVWGGGLYEDDRFYETCDEMGVLVWQDFLFACGMYPAYPEFQRSVRAEAEAAVRRLRHHASLVLWCGNNEDYAIAESVGAYDPAFVGDFTTTAFPARAIYEKLLPDVCQQLDPMRPYWPGSPYGGPRSSDQTIGDRHSWEIWHGPMADFRDYPKYRGRFVSEFGMQAFPNLETINTFAEPAEQFPESRVMDHHNKATDGPKRLAWYLTGNVRAAEDFAEYVYLTQFIQAESSAAAIDGWRRLWSGTGDYRTGGALIWQINDCWPVTSWALADYYKRPKLAYYRYRRCLAELALGLARNGDKVDLWAMNGKPEAVTADLDVRVWSFDGESLQHEQWPVQLAANRSTELRSMPYQLYLERGAVISARLIIDGEVAARSTLWPEPPKYYTLPDPGLQVQRLAADTVRISVERPARALALSAGDAVSWSDNMLDLLPGDDQIVRAVGLNGDQFKVRWLGAPHAITIADGRR